MLGRLSRPAEFEAVLATPIKARSAHFAAHHLPHSPRRYSRPKTRRRVAELSTVDSDGCAQAVDDPHDSALEGWWIAVVVPKRHARRATTRNLLRREVRSALMRHHPRLSRGMWLVRLRSAFDSVAFEAATSAALRGAARAELDALLTRAAA